MLFIIVAAPISLPTHNYKSSLSPISLPSFVICVFFLKTAILIDVW